jgi:hypothetical protein
MNIITISIFTLIATTILFILIRRSNNKKRLVSEVSREQFNQWRKERRSNKQNITLDVQAMGDNIEKSHDLWKKLSVQVHESKWIGKSQEKIELASQLNSLVNKHKENYNELIELKKRIENELIEKLD